MKRRSFIGAVMAVLGGVGIGRAKAASTEADRPLPTVGDLPTTPGRHVYRLDRLSLMWKPIQWNQITKYDVILLVDVCDAGRYEFRVTRALSNARSLKDRIVVGDVYAMANSKAVMPSGLPRLCDLADSVATYKMLTANPKC